MSLMGPYSCGVFAFSSKRRTSSPIYPIKIDFCCYIRQKWIFLLFASLKSLSVVRIVCFLGRKNFSRNFLSRFSSESLEIITNETSVLISGSDEVISSTMDQWGANKGCLRTGLPATLIYFAWEWRLPKRPRGSVET